MFMKEPTLHHTTIIRVVNLWIEDNPVFLTIPVVKQKMKSLIGELTTFLQLLYIIMITYLIGGIIVVTTTIMGIDIFILGGTIIIPHHHIIMV